MHLAQVSVAVLCRVGVAAAMLATPVFADDIDYTTIDVVLVVDNSASMESENAEVEAQLYDHLVVPLEADGRDVRVIVVSRFGTTGADLCFEDPLGAIPFGACGFSPPQPALTDAFKHYSANVQSWDAWCILKRTFDGSLADEFGLAPGGWSTWLRANAFKVIIVVSDDRVNCFFGNDTYNDGNDPATAETAAASFDSDLLALSPAHFGTPSERRYVYHSLIGILEPSGSGSLSYLHSEPFQLNQCSTGAAAGLGHQALSRLSKGLRHPGCPLFQVGFQYAEFFEDVANQLPVFVDGFESGSFAAWSNTSP